MAGYEILKNDLTSGQSATIKHTIMEDGVPVIPDTVTWTLLDGDRAVVNSRRTVPATPGAPTLIHLDPADLTAAAADEVRYLTITAVYTSLIYESDAGETLQFEDGTTWQFEDETTFETEGSSGGRVCTSVKQYRFSVRKPVEEAL